MVEERRPFDEYGTVQASLYDVLAVWIETCILFARSASQQDQNLMRSSDDQSEPVSQAMTRPEADVHPTESSFCIRDEPDR